MINLDSIDNMVSKLIVDKLKLVTVHHPKLYKFSWFKNGEEILVSKNTRSNFVLEGTKINFVLMYFL